MDNKQKAELMVRLIDLGAERSAWRGPELFDVGAFRKVLIDELSGKDDKKPELLVEKSEPKK